MTLAAPLTDATTRCVTDERGTIVRLEVSTADRPDPFDRFALADGTARWRTPVDSGTAGVAVPAFYWPRSYNTFNAARLAAFLLERPQQTADLLPFHASASARVEPDQVRYEVGDLHDSEAATIRMGMTVVVEGERITAVGAGSVPIPAGATILDATGKTGRRAAARQRVCLRMLAEGSLKALYPEQSDLLETLMENESCRTGQQRS